MRAVPCRVNAEKPPSPYPSSTREMVQFIARDRITPIAIYKNGIIRCLEAKLNKKQKYEESLELNKKQKYEESLEWNTFWELIL